MPGVFSVIAVALGWNIYASRHDHEQVCQYIRRHPKAFLAFCGWFGVHLARPLVESYRLTRRSLSAS